MSITFGNEGEPVKRVTGKSLFFIEEVNKGVVELHFEAKNRYVLLYDEDQPYRRHKIPEGHQHYWVNDQSARSIEVGGIRNRQRSNTFNSNNSAYAADQENRAKQTQGTA